MKKMGKLGAITLALVIVLGIASLVIFGEIIPSGYVGVVYSLNGGANGEVLDQGFNFIAPGKKVKQFTVGYEQLVLSKDKKEGSKDDDSFLVATSDNANIRISFQMTYKFDRAKVVDVYKNFKGMDGEDIVENRVKTIIRSKLSEVTRHYSIMDIYSGDRGKINREITEYLDSVLHDQFGISVINADIIDCHPDEQLQQTISDRVTALQKQQQAKAEQETIKVQNETKLLQAEADARERQIKAESDAEVKRIQAEAEADAALIKSSAEAEAIEKINKALTQNVLEKMKIEQWDGKLPVFTGASNSIISVDDFVK